jgi:hypothetical protein
VTDVVLVPTYCRPDYLTVCLEHLSLAENHGGKYVFVQHDHRETDPPEVLVEAGLSQEVATSFGSKFRAVFFSLAPSHRYVGNSFNCLELYKLASSVSDARYVYLVEDDVIVTKDFFKWHEAVQGRGDYFASVGWRCSRNPDFKGSEDPTAYVESARDYASIGVCWQRDKLAPLLEHAKPEYYSNLGGYVRATFPNSVIPTCEWTEQDGIVTRLLHERDDRLVAWPELPRCAHIGIQGYHRRNGHRFVGSLAQRTEALRGAIDNSTLANMSQDNYKDVTGLSDIPLWSVQDLHVTQRFGHEAGKI